MSPPVCSCACADEADTTREAEMEEVACLAET